MLKHWEKKIIMEHIKQCRDVMNLFLDLLNWVHFTLKKDMVAPSLTTPYSILVCLAMSSAESTGESILSTVRKAAKLAV